MRTRTLLLVEDNPDDEALAKRVFAKIAPNDRMEICRDGVQALERLSSKSLDLPDLVLLDLKMPKIGGLDVLSKVRSELNQRCLTIVVLTSSDEQHDITEAYRRGANSFVRKPVDYHEFRDCFEKILSYWFNLNCIPAPGCSAPGGL